jgi:endonuclease/exonuclease/phosphatase (EEP) superfamily protein YafD
MLHIIVLAAGAFVIGVTLLSLVRSPAWWIRIWDFPRLQLAVVGTATLAGAWFAAPALDPGIRWPFMCALTLAVAYQLAFIWRYSRLAPVEVQRSRGGDAGTRISLAISNVLQSNRESDRVLEVLRSCDPDVVLCVETNDWWRDRLDALRATHPHRVQAPLSNTYGMLLYSRLPLHDMSVDFLVQPDIPSIQARVELPGGQLVWLNCVHPRPPVPGESDESLERDAELLVVGKRVCDAALPVVVCGDLNDVAWSRSTRLFQKTSRLVDPRKGRGLFSTFNARIPGIRFPLDHIFHSDSFRLVTMRRLPYVGSDHFPVFATLSFEPLAAREQDAPTADAGDEQDARATIAAGRSDAPSGG